MTWLVFHNIKSTPTYHTFPGEVFWCVHSPPHPALSDSRIDSPGHRGAMGHRILPVEIWGMIFEFSTACPEEWELGTRERYGALFNWLFGPNYTTQQWGGALKTRHSMVAVSRFFNRLTTPLLYQSFFAIQSGQISRFRSTLETRPALGKHIKRLGFLLRLDMYPHELYLPIIRDCPCKRHLL